MQCRGGFWSRSGSWLENRALAGQVSVRASFRCDVGHDLVRGRSFPLVTAAESGMPCACSLPPGIT